MSDNGPIPDIADPAIAHNGSSLRDRIAAVLHDLYGTSLGYADEPWYGLTETAKDEYRADADAVIAALPELRRIAHVREVCSDPKRCFCSGQQFHTGQCDGKFDPFVFVFVPNELAPKSSTPRDRILLALIESTPSQYLPPPNDMSKQVDAVIAALGLREERHRPNPYPGRVLDPDVGKHRYVTEWEPETYCTRCGIPHTDECLRK